MSVRAHRVNEINYESNETFNLWHHTKLMDFLEGEGFYSELNEDGCGIVEISVETLERALKEDLADDGNEGGEEYIKDNIRKDIEWAKAGKKDYVQYYCF